MRTKRRLRQKAYFVGGAEFSDSRRALAFRESTPSSTNDTNCARQTSPQGGSVSFARSTAFAMSNRKDKDLNYVSASADGDITAVKVDRNNNCNKVIAVALSSRS